jgi:glutaredoxin
MEFFEWWKKKKYLTKAQTLKGSINYETVNIHKHQRNYDENKNQIKNYATLHNGRKIWPFLRVGAWRVGFEYLFSFFLRIKRQNGDWRSYHHNHDGDDYE